MPRIADVHPTRSLRTPSGLTVAIDLDIALVIQALWDRKLTTLMSRQDVGEAMADGGMWLATGISGVPSRRRRLATTLFSGQARRRSRDGVRSEVADGQINRIRVTRYLDKRRH
ncbi:hypothetical protein ACQEU3_43350 [Spirillospora sp. CA-253888]